MCIRDRFKEKGVQLAISLTGLAVRNRMEIEEPEVFGVANSEAAVQDEKAEKGKQCITTFSVLQEGVDPLLRPQLEFLTGVGCHQG